jgi:PTS system D-glucosamine-specific IIC component
MIYFANIADWFKYNVWWLFIVLVLLVCVILFFRLNNKPKKVNIAQVDDESINDYIKAYGGISNIKKAELDGRRLKVSVIKVDAIDLDELKSLGATGIFITGQNIKMVLPYDMQKLVDKMNELIDGGKK